jgi:hypothetical protein
MGRPRAYAVQAQGLHVGRVAAPGKNAAVHGGVQRLHSTVQHFREGCQLLGRREERVRAASRSVALAHASGHAPLLESRPPARQPGRMRCRRLRPARSPSPPAPAAPFSSSGSAETSGSTHLAQVDQSCLIKDADERPTSCKRRTLSSLLSTARMAAHQQRARTLPWHRRHAGGAQRRSAATLR